MRIIVVTGGGRHVGKTELANALGGLLPDSRVVKLGEHARRDGKNALFFSLDTRFRDVVNAVGECAFLILESGRILDDPNCRSDLVIFLPHSEADKPGAERRRGQADIIRGERVDGKVVEQLRQRLGIDRQTISQLLEMVGSTVEY